MTHPTTLPTQQKSGGETQTKGSVSLQSNQPSAPCSDPSISAQAVGGHVAQLGLLYMLTSIINRGRNLRAAGEKDVVWYWAWMVCIAIVRFVVPVPIALRSVFNIARIVRQHDWSEATQRIPPSSTVVSPRTADAEHPNPNRRSSPPQAARARDGTPTDSLRSDSGISEQVHVLPSGTDKGGLPTWRCRVLRASHGDDTHPAA